MNRHVNITEAKKLCPELIMQHVATWKEGDEKWAYHPDAFANIATHKVSLDPYRLESRRILACVKDVLPPPPIQRVEKASVDEFFLDLSAQIHCTLLERYPEISGPAPYDDPTKFLPRPPTTALDWKTDALVDLDVTETEDDDPDWDDVAMCIGSEIVRSVRAAIVKCLKYTCSAGIARNKTIAKLGSGHKKPNQQTIVRNRAVQYFLGDIKYTKIRNLGGKLGEEVASKFGTDQVQELLKAPLEHLKSRIGDDTGTWVYQVIRGEDYSEVNSRTQIKSMLSAKSFRPSINTFEQAVRWLRIFAADIFSRLVEEGVVENKRRPKTINLHHRQAGQMRSRQAPIPTGRPINESLLFDLAKNLLGQIVVDGLAWPCANLQLSVGGLEDGPKGNLGIGGFLLRGKEAKTMKATARDAEQHLFAENEGQPDKRRKLENGAIQRFFPRSESSHEEFDEEEMLPPPETENGVEKDYKLSERELDLKPRQQGGKPLERLLDVAPSLHQFSIESYVCDRCSKAMPTTSKREHEDWHFAKDLQAQERQESRSDGVDESPTVVPSHGPKGSRSGKSSAVSNQKSVEKGQKRLAFG